MWRQVAKEIVVVAVGAAFVFMLAASWGLSGGEPSSGRMAAWPALMLRPRADVDPALAILEGWQKCGTSDSVCVKQFR